MSPDLPEKLLGISIDDPSDRPRAATDDRDDEERERFVFFSLGDLRLAVSVDDVKTISSFPDPEDVTRVPRAPAAIEGLVDLRGEITVLVEPRVHFPVERAPPAAQRLLVFDRPTDRQPAAIRVDDVLGVESVPVSDVVGEGDLDDDAATDGALEHPLVRALVRRERTVGARRDRPTRGATAGSAADAGRSAVGFDADDGRGGDAESGLERWESRPSLTAARTETSEAFGESGSRSQSQSQSRSQSRSQPQSRSRSQESTGSDEPGADERRIVTDVTALVDVDRLLLASGQID